MKTFKVKVELRETSQPVCELVAFNAYTRGPFYCIYCLNGKVVKYPVQHIFRVVEDYKQQEDNE
jgi:hypothetical protein